MGKQNDVGVFQLENGKWAFRYTFTKNGKRSSKRSCKDEFGNSLNTKRAAIKARQIAVDAEVLNQPLKPVFYHSKSKEKRVDFHSHSIFIFSIPCRKIILINSFRE